MAESKPSDPATYTKPELRDRIKKKVIAGDKGGNAGQWSARKAQIVTHEYEAEGGGYKKPRNESQKNLKKWGDEQWQTSDGARARRQGGTARYLPKKAWEELSPAEKGSTNKKKKEGSREGRQFVSNTKAAATARKKSAKKTAANKKSRTATKRKSTTKHKSS